MLAESSVGGMFTYGDPRSNGDAWLGGLVFNWQKSRLLCAKGLTGNRCPPETLKWYGDSKLFAEEGIFV